MPFGSGPPRRRPYPYDAIVNGTGVMLWSPPKAGQAYRNSAVSTLTAEHPTPLTNTQPSEYKPTAQNPAVENAFEWRDFSLGMGLRQQVGDNDRRYRFAAAADCSIQNQVIFGPLISTITPSAVDATNGISGFFEIGGVLYAVNGRYVHKRTSDADWNTSRKEFGAGKAALDHVHFFTNVSGGADFVYIAMGDAEFLYKFDGTTYTQHASLYARAFCMQGRDLWRSPATNTLAKVDVDADPWTAGNWSASNAFTIGEKGSGITRLVLNAAGVLVILKTDGIYTLDEVGEDHQLFPGMRFAIDSQNGKYPYLSENWLYVTYGGTHYRLDQSMSIEPIGPEQNADNDSVVKGYITAGVGTQFANYAGIYNPDTGHSYLMKFGAWVSDEQGSNKRIDAWHGSLSNVELGLSVFDFNDFGSDKITAMWRSAIGADSGHERVYIGMLSGKISWFQLPCTPNPANCSNYDYSASYDGASARQAHVFVPYWHGGFPNNEKNVLSTEATASSLDANNSLSAMYARSVGSGGSYTPYAWNATAVPGARRSVGKVGTLLDMYFVLLRGAQGGGGVSSTPVSNGFGITYHVHPPISLVYKSFMVLAENHLTRRDGTPIRIGADKIRSLIKAACELTSGVTVITADETSQTLILQDYTEDLVWDEGIKQFRAIVSFTGVSTTLLQGDSSVHVMA